MFSLGLAIMSLTKALWLIAILGPGAVFVGMCLGFLPGPSFAGLDVLSFVIRQLTIFSLLIFLLAFPGGICFLIAGIRSRGGKKSVWAGVSRWLACWCFCLLFVVALRGYKKVRSVAMMNAALTGSRISEALDRYRADHGAYPDEFDDLVPQYVDQIPFTGMVGYPQFYYKSGANIPGSGGYEIGINCPIAVLNWDKFFYWPSKAYPKSIYGGSVEPIGDWAYVHE